MKNFENKVDFFSFVYLWFKIQGLKMPKHQQKMILWIEKIWASENRNALLMAFRNSGKSTIVGLFCAWTLYRQNDLRIMVLAADEALADKMVRNVKHIIERHVLTKDLRPQKPEEWAADKFTIKRQSELRDPSMLAKGIEANLTGLRADLIICDDVEVPNNSDSEEKRKDLRRKLDELDYIISPSGMLLYIGTPHTYYSIYQTKTDENKPDAEPYLLGFDEFRLPILDKYGQSAWPERFSLEKIHSIRLRSGERKFASQMLLKAVDVQNSRLKPEDIRVYDDKLDISFSNEQEVLKIANKRMVAVSCWWDPAFAQTADNDNSVIACVFTDEDGKYYLHDLEYIKTVISGNDDNVASMQCEKVIAFIERNHIPALHVEINGIGRFLPGILRQKLSEKKLRVAVLEEYSRQNKQARILEAFEVLLAEKALYASSSVIQSGFAQEMREWGFNKNCHDDALDAVAGCLLIAPIRLKGVYNGAKAERRFGWQGNAQQFSAFCDFKI